MRYEIYILYVYYSIISVSVALYLPNIESMPELCITTFLPLFAFALTEQHFEFMHCVHRRDEYITKIGTICGAAAELIQPQKKPPASLMARLSLSGCNLCHTSKGRTFNGAHAELAQEDKSFLGQCRALSFFEVHRCRTLPSRRWTP